MLFGDLKFQTKESCGVWFLANWCAVSSVWGVHAAFSSEAVCRAGLCSRPLDRCVHVTSAESRTTRSSRTICYTRQCFVVISGFHRQVNENYALLDYYAARRGNFLSTFQDNLSVLSSRVTNPKSLDCWQLKIGPIGCPETSVRNYHYSLPNSPGDRSS